ncbi:MAG: hypothetical protein JW750_05870 [Anaerolineaceae bacterium]|nr:hypothetical protein [Anaerolineaceae bacterium]
MKIAQRYSNLAFFVVVLMLVSIACNLPFGNFGKKETPLPTVSVSISAAHEVEQMLEQIQTDLAENGEFAVTITEEQITSYFLLKMEEEYPDFPLEDLQVHFDDNLIVMNGKAELGGSLIKVDVEIILSAKVNETGDLEVEIVETDLGPLPVSDTLENTLSETFNDFFSSQIADAANVVQINTVYIDNGTMTIAGSR